MGQEQEYVVQKRTRMRYRREMDSVAPFASFGVNRVFTRLAEQKLADSAAGR